MTEYLPPVSQKLDADISTYVAKLKAAEGALDDFKDSSGKASTEINKDSEEVGQGFEDLGDKAKKAGDDVDAGMGKSKKSVSDFDRLVRGNIKSDESAFTQLSKAVDDTKTHLAGLRQEFARSGSESVLGDIKKSEADLKSLQGYLKEMGTEATKTFKDSGQAVSDFDRLVRVNMTDGVSAFNALNKTIDSTKRAVTGLRAEYAKTGSSSILGDVKKAEADLKTLESIGTDMGTTASKGFISTFGEGLSSVGEYSTPILVGAVALAAPAMGAAIATAVTAGFGLGIMGIGVLAVKDNPQVKAAFSGLTADLKSVFSDAASPMIAPLVSGLHDLDGVVKEVKPGLKALFTAAAPGLRVFLDGIGGLVTGALPGFISAMDLAEPVIEQIGKDMPQLGAAFGSFVDEIASTPGLVADVDEGFKVLDGTIRVISGTIHELGAGFNVLSEVGDVMTGNIGAFADRGKTVPPVFQDIGKSMDIAVTATIDSKNAFDSNGISIGKNDAALQKLMATQNAWIQQSQANDDALLAMKEAETTFNTELKKGSKNWDENTVAGQAQVANLNSLNEKITANYAALAAVNPLTEKQTSAELKAETQLYNTAKAAGATSGELNTLKGEIADTTKNLNAMKSKAITIKITEHFITEGNANPSKYFHGLASGGVVHAASGLVSGILPPRSPGTLVMAGEPQTKGEIFMPLAGISRQRAMSLAQVAGDAHGFDVTPRGQMASMIGTGGGGGGSSVTNISVPVILGGKTLATVSRSLVATTQQAKIRGTVTGLG